MIVLCNVASIRKLSNVRSICPCVLVIVVFYFNGSNYFHSSGDDEMYGASGTLVQECILVHAKIAEEMTTWRTVVDLPIIENIPAKIALFFFIVHNNSFHCDSRGLVWGLPGTGMACEWNGP